MPRLALFCRRPQRAFTYWNSGGTVPCHPGLRVAEGWLQNGSLTALGDRTLKSSGQLSEARGTQVPGRVAVQSRFWGSRSLGSQCEVGGSHVVAPGPVSGTQKILTEEFSVTESLGVGEETASNEGGEWGNGGGRQGGEGPPGDPCSGSGRLRSPSGVCVHVGRTPLSGVCACGV